MIVITILLFIVAMSLPSFQTSISAVSVLRISALSFIYAGVLAFNALYIQEIGSGIGIYSGFFQVTTFSQYIDIFILLVAAIIVGIARPMYNISTLNTNNVIINNDTNNINTSNNQLSISYVDFNKGYVFIRKSVEHIVPKYSLIVLFSTLGSLMLVSCSDLISMYLSIELQSFGVYILATLYRDSALATSAGLKYFLLGGLSSCLILLGAGLIYSYTGLTNFESIYSLCGVSLYGNNSSLISQGLLIGFTIIFVGFLFKIAAAPLHNWAPDVYDDSPTIITIWLTIMPKIAILIFLLELSTGLISNHTIDILYLIKSILYTTTPNSTDTNLEYLFPILNLEIVEVGLNIIKDYSIFNSLDVHTVDRIIKQTSLNEDNNLLLLLSQGLQNLLLLSSLLSLLIGTIVGLSQTRIKRLLAYSTISHIGFMLLALSINTEQSIESFIFYIVQYTITNLNVFLIILAFSYIMYEATSRTRELNIANYRNQSYNETSSHEKLQFGDSLKQISKRNLSYIQAKEKRDGNFESDKDIRFISELKGQFFYNPLLSISFAICLFSMAGIPPLIGFFSKQMVLYTSMQSGYYFMSIVAILVSIISASYYLKIIKTLFNTSTTTNSIPEFNDYNTINQRDNTITSTKEEKGIEKPSTINTDISMLNNLDYRGICTNSHSFVISILTLTILLYILNPSILLNSTQLLSLTLFSSV